jgi:nucleotide-binding universal stress UspA family protein
MFRTILLPVDFEINTEMAVKKALELSDPGQTVIHLFHVQKPSMPWSFDVGK